MELEGVKGVDYEICKNCYQRISIAQITMHELRCARINWYCAACNMAVLKTDKDKHEQEYHTEYICEWCGDSKEKRHIIDHKKNECPMRTVSCKFCSLPMIYKKLFLHERSCGSVTELCSKCKLRFPRSGLSAHEPSCNGSPAPSSPLDFPPMNSITPSYYNQSKSSNNYIPANNNDIMICEKCQQVLNSYEELQIHVFTEHIDGDDMTVTDNNSLKNTDTDSTTDIPQTSNSPVAMPQTINSPVQIQRKQEEENVIMTEVSRASKRPNEEVSKSQEDTSPTEGEPKVPFNHT